MDNKTLRKRALVWFRETYGGYPRDEMDERFLQAFMDGAGAWESKAEEKERMRRLRKELRHP